MADTPTRASRQSAFDQGQRAKRAAYMRNYRAQNDYRTKPECRVIDRSLISAIGIYVAALSVTDGEKVMDLLSDLASRGLEAEGYDLESVKAAALTRLLVNTNLHAQTSVHIAARERVMKAAKDRQQLAKSC